MTTPTITPTPAADPDDDGLQLAYGPRPDTQTCRACHTTLEADPAPDFGYEDGTGQPICDPCTARLDPPGFDAIRVLRFIAEAASSAAPDAAQGFLYDLGQGVELLLEDLEERPR